jgi:hypothetical protein
MASEYEGTMVNARALYDQLQFVLRALWDVVIQDGKRELPDTFNKLAEADASALRSKYRLPEPFANFVERASATFCAIREVRVGIEHHGKTHLGFFILNEGFAVDTNAYPWRRFDVWYPETVINNGLGSYLAFLASFVREVLAVLDEFDRAIHAAIPLPAPVTQQRVFLRSTVNRHLTKLDQYVREPGGR